MVSNFNRDFHHILMEKINTFYVDNALLQTPNTRLTHYNGRGPFPRNCQICFLLFRSYDILFRLYGLIRTNEIILRTNKIIFRKNEILIRTNEILFRSYELILRTNKIIFLNVSYGPPYYTTFKKSSIIIIRGFARTPAIYPIISTQLLELAELIQLSQMCHKPQAIHVVLKRNAIFTFICRIDRLT